MVKEEYNHEPGDGKLTYGFAMLTFFSALSFVAASELPLPTWAKPLVAVSVPSVSVVLITEGFIEKFRTRRKTSLRK